MLSHIGCLMAEGPAEQLTSLQDGGRLANELTIATFWDHFGQHWG